MAIKDTNLQVYTTLDKELVKLIDKKAKDNSRTRSKEIALALKKYYEDEKVD